MLATPLGLEAPALPRESWPNNTQWTVSNPPLLAHKTVVGEIDEVYTSNGKVCKAQLAEQESPASNLLSTSTSLAGAGHHF
jgi:hypothetical protein